MKRQQIQAGFLMAAAAVLTTVALQARQAPPVDISGKWKLNVGESNNPNGPPAPARGTGGGGARGGGGADPTAALSDSSVRAGSVNMNVGGSLGPEEMARLNAGRKMFETAPVDLAIEISGKDIVLTYNNAPKPTFTETFDKSKKIKSPSVGELEFKDKWDGKTLKREISTQESLKVTEVYSLSPDGKQLIVTVKSDSGMTKIPDGKIKRVYDKVM